MGTNRPRATCKGRWIVDPVPSRGIERNRAGDALVVRCAAHCGCQCGPLDHEVLVRDPRYLLEMPEQERGCVKVEVGEGKRRRPELALITLPEPEIGRARGHKR